MMRISPRTVIKAAVVGTAVTAVIAVTLWWGTYNWGWDWTGIGPIPALSNHVPVSIGQLPKTLWDVLQLVGIFAIPVVVTLAAAAINQAQQHREEQNAVRREQESVLETYLNQMANLLLHEKLLVPPDEVMESGHKRSSGDAFELGDKRVQNVARAVTLTALRRLDGDHKAVILQFLNESDLIARNKPAVSLKGVVLDGADLRSAKLRRAALSEVDLKEAHLEWARLEEADLKEAHLEGAHLHNAHLKGADLKGAYLNGADLEGADLEGADLEGATGTTTAQFDKVKSLVGATLPDGTKHP